DADIRFEGVGRRRHRAAGNDQVEVAHGRRPLGWGGAIGARPECVIQSLYVARRLGLRTGAYPAPLAGEGREGEITGSSPAMTPNEGEVTAPRTRCPARPSTARARRVAAGSRAPPRW